MSYRFIFLLMLISPSQGLSWTEPDFKSCDFYSDAESSMRCQDRGSNYLLDYGFYYCQKFKEKSASWSVKASQWATSTGQCLQEMLFDNRQNRLSSCRQLEEFAFDSHPICYKQYGFCNLDLKDKFTILSTIRGIDLISRNSLSQSLNIVLACGKDLWIPAEEATFHELAKITATYSYSEKSVAEQFFSNAPIASKDMRNNYFKKAVSLLLGLNSKNEDANGLKMHIDQYTNPHNLQRNLDMTTNSPFSKDDAKFVPSSRLREFLEILTSNPDK